MTAATEEWDLAEGISAFHQQPGRRWVKAIAEIRNNATGEVREYPTHEIIDGDETEPSPYIWRDGNFSCDCNRESFFYRAHKEEEPDNECSDGRYSVRVKNAKTGRVFYSEFEPAG